MENKHPDILALAEGRLDPGQARAEADHLDNCEQCRSELAQMQQDLRELDDVLQAVSLGFPDSDMLAEELDKALGPLPGAASGPLAGGWVETSAADAPLPPNLARALKGGGDSLADRLRRSVQAITGKSREGAENLAGRILGAGGHAAASPAIREDATEDKPDGGDGGDSGEDNGKEQ